MREKIDLGSDIALLLAQLRRLAASRLGQRLGLKELVLVDPELAQVIIDLDAAVSVWGDKEVKQEWEALKRRIVRKAALIGVKKLSESSLLFIAAAAESKERGEEEWEG